MSSLRALTLLALAGLIATQSACAGVSENNRRGIWVAGGAALVVGSLLTMDGLSCDEVATGNGQACDEDVDELRHGIGVLVVAAALIGLGVYLELTATDAAP